MLCSDSDADEDSDNVTPKSKSSRKRKTIAPTSSGSTHQHGKGRRNRDPVDTRDPFDAGWETDSFEHGMEMWPMGCVQVTRLRHHAIGDVT